MSVPRSVDTFNALSLLGGASCLCSPNSHKMSLNFLAKSILPRLSLTSLPHFQLHTSTITYAQSFADFGMPYLMLFAPVPTLLSRALVPGEADLFRARAAFDANRTIFTSDSDLLLYAFGSFEEAAFLNL